MSPWAPSGDNYVNRVGCYPPQNPSITATVLALGTMYTGPDLTWNRFKFRALKSTPASRALQAIALGAGEALRIIAHMDLEGRFRPHKVAGVHNRKPAGRVHAYAMFCHSDQAPIAISTTGPLTTNTHKAFVYSRADTIAEHKSSGPRLGDTHNFTSPFNQEPINMFIDLTH